LKRLYFAKWNIYYYYYFFPSSQALYNSGARKVALNGIGPIGCAPHSTANYDTKGSLCVDYMNDAVNYFNSRLISLVNQLNNDLADARFIYLNAIGFGLEYTASPGNAYYSTFFDSSCPFYCQIFHSVLLVITHLFLFTSFRFQF
jgi:hypothetical protein